MRDQARVVIIGAGIVGCSVAYYLTQLGWRDVVVLEQGPLFKVRGSTSHAPGLMFQHNNSRSFCQIAQWAVQTYAQVEARERCFWQVGSLEIAHTAERWHELKRKIGNALAWGLEAHLIGPSEVKDHVPHMRTDDLYGAFYVPSDCDVKGVVLLEGLTRMAEAGGAVFYPHTRVTDIEVKASRVEAVVTEQGRIRCEHVVCAAGLWGPVVGRMAGVAIPQTPCQHLYVKTRPLPELAGAVEELEQPIVRYQDKDLYFRQYYDAYGFGSYRHEPLLVPADELPTHDHPAIFPFTPEHFQASLADVVERYPCLAGAPLVEPFNGLFSFTPDGCMNLGESASVRGFWSAEAVWVTHGGGVGKVIAEWMVGGQPSLDLREHDVNRWHSHAVSRPYVRARAERQYIEVYDIIHPLQQVGTPRGLRHSPFHPRLAELGAVFFESAGWERPQWFETNPPLLPANGIGLRSGWAAENWSPLIGAEHTATRTRAGLFDLTPFTKLEVSGPGALAYLQRLASNQMDQPIGRVTYTALLTPQAGIQCDLTITRLGPDRFWVITGGGTGPLDLAWLRRHLPDDGSVQLTDVSSAYACLGLWGPQARTILQTVTDTDVSNTAFPYLTARSLFVGYVPTLALRISYVGELGWEIYTPTEYGLALWDTLWRAGRAYGLTPVGGGAFDSLRLEKGYRLWGADIYTEYNPYEAGLGFAIRLNKGEFIGREALQRIKTQGITRKLCCLTLDDPTQALLGKEPILAGDRVLGHVTSANTGYSVGHSIAYGYLPVEYAIEGTAVQVYCFGERYSATVTREPLYDPHMTRLKS